MKVIGIIAEYNPFHNGHFYHLLESRTHINPDAVVCVMSGHFTQRGEPALVNKWLRTEMALRAGVDLVFELPFAFAARSASNFARGAVQLLERTGIVTHLSFGSETGDLKPLQNIATILNLEPPRFQNSLHKFLREGLNYPTARSRALETFISGNNSVHLNTRSILLNPNNILAIEYLRALDSEFPSAIPITIKRLGAGYYENGDQNLSSATFIRSQLLDGKTPEQLQGLPDITVRLLLKSMVNSPSAVNSRLFEFIVLTLKRMNLDEIARLCDVSEGLENRIKSAIDHSYNLESLFNNIKTRRYSRTRLNRVLLYALLNFTQDKSRFFDNLGPQYLRLLGFSPQGQKILHKIKSKSCIPVITKVGSLNRYSDATKEMLFFDVLASDIYSLMQPGPYYSGLDYLMPPVQIKPD
ncbi:MAG: nucleotidyltransferase [Chitinophagales bacterium]